MEYLRSLLPAAKPTPLYTPGMRQNMVNAATDPYNKYYKPKNTPMRGLQAPSEQDAERMDELLNINTFKRPLTQEEVDELRSYNVKYGLPPVVRYSDSVGRYLTKRQAYLKDLKNSTARRNTYNNLRRAETMMNFPHQVNAPPDSPNEGYSGIPMTNVLGQIVKVKEGGKRKTRRVKRKSSTRRRRSFRK